MPTLVRLRLGTVNDEVLRRRYLRLETAHVEGQRKLAQGKGGGRSLFGGSSPTGGATGATAEKVARQRDVKAQLVEIENLKMRQAAGDSLEIDEIKRIAGGDEERKLRAELEELTIAINVRLGARMRTLVLPCHIEWRWRWPV